MTVYVLVNWIACLATAALLIFVFARERFLLVKPSIMVILFFHVRIQWSATLEAASIASFLPNPWVFALLCQGFPLIGLLVARRTGRGTASRVWQRLAHPSQGYSQGPNAVIVLLAFFVVAFTGFYLLNVPFTSTGLYALLRDPAGYVMAREESLKLVDSSLIKYGYALTAKTIVPLLSILLLAQLIWNTKKNRFGKGLFLLVSLALLLMAVTLSGARAYPAIIILGLVLAWAWRKGVSIRPAYLVSALLAVLLFPTLITVLRSGRGLDWSIFWDVFSEVIVDRVVGVPMRTGLYFTHYAQTVGYLGLPAIPKLAMLLGVEPINSSNMLGLIYLGSSVASTYMNTGYVHAYYAYFGLIAFPFCLLGLWLLDLALAVYTRIYDDLLLLACVVSASLAVVSLIGTDYTTALLTGGFVPVLLIVWVLDAWLKKQTPPPRAVYSPAARGIQGHRKGGTSYPH